MSSAGCNGVLADDIIINHHFMPTTYVLVRRGSVSGPGYSIAKGEEVTDEVYKKISARHRRYFDKGDKPASTGKKGVFNANPIEDNQALAVENEKLKARVAELEELMAKQATALEELASKSPDNKKPAATKTASQTK